MTHIKKEVVARDLEANPFNNDNPCWWEKPITTELARRIELKLVFYNSYDEATTYSTGKIINKDVPEEEKIKAIDEVLDTLKYTLLLKLGVKEESWDKLKHK